MSLKKNDPLRLDVSFLIKGSPGTYKEFEFNFPQLHFSPDFTVVNIQGTITVSVTEDGVVAEGKLLGLTQLSCSRCLEDYWQPLTINFTEIFSAHPVHDEGNGQEELYLPADGSIDLTDILRDYALLDIPIRHLCKEDCRGLCPVCGQNLNLKDCGHRPEDVDPRFESLRDLLEEQDQESHS
jgi:uncharacterized protein